MNSYSPKQRQELIMEAYLNPRYRVEDLKDSNIIKENSLVCVDEIQIALTWENSILKDAKYLGKGCAIFLSSIEIMLAQIKDRTLNEIETILDLYLAMLNGKKLVEEEQEKLGKLIIFENVKVHLNRLECASIIYRVIKKGLVDARTK